MQPSVQNYVVKRSKPTYHDAMTRSETHKIGIVGAGAMGLTFAAQFLKAGFDVRLYEKDPAVRQILQDGFDLISDMGTTHFANPLVNDPALLADASQVFVFVKSTATADVAAMLSAILTSHTVVVTLQNGLGNVETLRAQGLSVVAGTTAVGATRLEGARVRLAGMGLTVVGRGHSAAPGNKAEGSAERAPANQRNKDVANSDTVNIDAVNNDADAALQTVVATLARAGFPVKQVDHVRQAIWHKAIINAAINPLAGIMNVTNGELLEFSYIRSLQQAVIAEAVAVAATQGIVFAAESVYADVEKVCRVTATNLCSMLQDLHAHRATEIMSINGAFVSLGEKEGLALPVNDTLCRLILARG